MAFTPKTWVDGSGGGTPITAAELNRMESGIRDASRVSPTTYTTSQTLTLAHEGALLLFDSSLETTLTIPPNSSVAIPVGSRIRLIQMGTGGTTVTAGTGVTLNAIGGNRKTSGRYGAVDLVKVGTDSWVAVGDLAAAASGGGGSSSGIARPAATRTVNPTTNLSALFSTFVAGEVIYLNAGTYGARDNKWVLTNSGTVNSRIQVYAAPGANVEILGMFQLEGDYWTIGDVHFAGPTGYVNAGNNAGLGTANQEGEDDQVWLKGAVGTILDRCRVSNNYWNAGVFLSDGSNDVIIQNCLIDNNGPWHDPYQEHNAGQGPANNLSHGVYNGYGSHNMTVRNCVFYKNLAYGLQLYPEPGNCKIYNNTFVSNGVPGATNSLYGGGIIVWTSGASNRIFNNVFYDNGRAVHAGGNVVGGSTTVEYNQTWASRVATFTTDSAVTYTNNTSVNPLFVSATSDWHLQAGSGAINAGVASNYSISAPTTDRDGVTRTGNPDVGAYEYVAP